MKIKSLITLLLFSSFIASSADQFNWPVWRGPSHNSISLEKDWDPKALEKNKVIWRKELGLGYSQCHIQDGLLLTQGNKDDQNTIFCLDAKTGKEIWTFKYHCLTTKKFRGSFLSPIILGDKVYSVSRELDMYCLDLKTGKLIWNIDLHKKYGLVPPTYYGFGANMKNLGNDRLLLSTGNTGVMISAKDGRLIWGKPGESHYGVPVPYTLDGKKYICLWSKESLIGVEEATGKVVWSHKWVTEYDMNGPDPIVVGDQVFITTGYNHGCALLSIKDNNPKVIWENKNLQSHFTSPVLIDGYIYGVQGQANSRGSLVCLEWKTGKKMWSEKTGFGNFMVADGKILFQEERGNIKIVEVNPKKYVEIASVKTELDKVCWAFPTLCNGLLYSRNNKGRMICLDLRK